jgi:alkylation response protein AidB-like acyl-CoA dehydrogenase
MTIVDFSLPPDTERFRAELRSWLAANLTEDVISAGHRHMSDPDTFATLRGWSRTLADAGWAAVSWPREYGGRGAGALEQLVQAEETVRARAPLHVNIIGINNIAPALLQFGTPEQKSGLLPRMLRADDIWCQGMSEPAAGSDLAALNTRAVRQGDDFIVSGQKLWTSLGHRADWCQLYVRTDPDAPKHQGISCLIVDMTSPGIEARPLTSLTGDADFAEVFFTDVCVPIDALLGPLNGGWQVATTTLGHERAGAARLCAELEVRLADLVIDAVRERPGQLRLVEDRHMLARLGELEMRINALKVLTQRSVSAALHGGDGVATAGLAKMVWAELGQDLAALGFDLLGSRDPDGRWAEHRLAARSMTIAGGTTEIMKTITATRLLGLPRT